MFRNLFSRRKSPKLFVIGLDCAAPEMLFDQWRRDLPNLAALMDRGAYREMMSCTPAITVPAWSVMTSSKDPGTLGFYGFRNRRDHSYDNRYIANSKAVKEKRVWQILDEAGKKCIVLGVPQTYPIVPIENGHIVSSFLTPNTTSERIQWTHPPSLRKEIVDLLAPEDYDVDVKQFRTDDKDFLMQQLYDMTRKRFKVLRYLLDNKPWDFFMFVEMGTDRIHHGMWGTYDPSHRKYDPDSPYVNAMKSYYLFLDKEIGTLIEKLPAEAHVMVVSDHGAKRMDGGICINEWLIEKGYLALNEDPPADALTALDKLSVDWSKTQVWGDGGYYARIWLNVEGREPNGTIPAEAYEAFRDRLAEELKTIPDHNGNRLNTRVFKPQKIYNRVKNVAPDLMVYFDDLGWRSVGTLGHGALHTFENDTGPDDANHAENGIMIYAPPKADDRFADTRLSPIQITDFAPTVLDLMGLDIPADMQGQVIRWE